MSGFYNVWPKVLHPDEVLPQMTSGGYQKPFYFGGSQVPESIGINNSLNQKGRGLTKPKLNKNYQETGVDRIDRILIPHILPSLLK